MKFRKVVLVIHGFAGGPYDEEKLTYYLTMRGFDVFTFTLPGHDRMLFNKITRNDWIKSCEEHLELLIKNRYNYIYVIGHSMGGVLASYLAAKYKEVKKLVLAAPAFKYLTFEEENFKFLTALKNSPKLFEDYKKEEIISRMLQFPTSVIKEFMELVKENQYLPSMITCPTLIIEGTKDKIVPVKSGEFVYKNLKSKTKYLMIVNGLTHDVFKDKNANKICVSIEKFLKFGIYVNDTN